MSDKRTIGLTPDAQSVLEEMMSQGHFREELDAAKFAFALAVNRGIPLGSADGVNTKWNIGSLDPSGELLNLLKALYPETVAPYRSIEYLMIEGFRCIARDIEEKGRFDALGLMKETPTSE